MPYVQYFKQWLAHLVFDCIRVIHTQRIADIQCVPYRLPYCDILTQLISIPFVYRIGHGVSERNFVFVSERYGDDLPLKQCIHLRVAHDLPVCYKFPHTQRIADGHRVH